MRNLKTMYMIVGLLPVVMLFTSADAFGQSSRQTTKQDAVSEQQQMRATLSDAEYAEWKLKKTTEMNAAKKADTPRGMMTQKQTSYKTNGGGHSDLEAPRRVKKTVAVPAMKTESVVQVTTLHDGTTIKRKVKTNAAMQELDRQAQINDIQEKMKTATAEEKSKLQQRLNNLK